MVVDAGGVVVGAGHRGGWDAERRTDGVRQNRIMTTARIIILFVIAAVAEIGGAWLMWQAVRENRGWTFALLGIIALGAYGFVAALQPDANFGRVLAAYGGVFVAGSLAWGIVIDGFKPTVWDYVGSSVSLLGAAIIILAPTVTSAQE